MKITEEERYEIFKMEGHPQYLKVEQGVFRPVKNIIYLENLDSSFTYEYEYVDNITKMIVGLNIIEISAGLSLVVRIPPNHRILPSEIYTAEKFARVACCDYFALDAIGSHSDNILRSDCKYNIREIMPRLFRKM